MLETILISISGAIAVVLGVILTVVVANSSRLRDAETKRIDELIKSMQVVSKTLVEASDTLNVVRADVAEIRIKQEGFNVTLHEHDKRLLALELMFKHAYGMDTPPTIKRKP